MAPTDPTDDELVAFAESTLGDLLGHLAEPDALEETVLGARDLWVLLYRAASDRESSD